MATRCGLLVPHFGEEADQDLLIEGARVSCQSVGTEGPGARFIAIAEATIAAFLHRSVAERPARKYAAVRAAPIKKTSRNQTSRQPLPVR